jgi:hypothetical protein
MVWTAQGFASPAEARLFARVAEERAAPPVDRLGRIVKIVWIAAVVMGAWGGFSLARVRSSKGLWAANTVLNSWKNLPRAFWGYLTTWFGTEALIGVGIILPLLFFLLSGPLRQKIFTLSAQIVFAVIVALLVGTITHFVGIFVYDLGPYFRFR